MSWFGLGGSKKPEPTPVIEHSFDNTPGAGGLSSSSSYSGGSDFGGSSNQGSLGGGFGGGGGGGMEDLQVSYKYKLPFAMSSVIGVRYI